MWFRFPLAAYVTRLALAEAAGIAVVAATYAALDRGLIGPQTRFILAAGAWEGLCLGLAQASVLHRMGTNGPLWTGLTVLAAVAGYALSLAAGAGGGGGAGVDPPLWLMLAGGAGLGLGMGLVMGVVQILALPTGLGRARWVLANALGWTPAMAVILLGAASAGPGWPLIAVAALGAACGACAGALVALATGTVLQRAA